MTPVLLLSLRHAVRPTLRTTLWLFKMLIPITLGVSLLTYVGAIEWLAQGLDPLFRHLGLPGSAAIAYLTGALNTTYAGIAVMMTLPLTLRQATIVSLMILLSHALPMESAVNRMTGSSFLGMVVLRVAMALLAALCLHAVLPAMDEPFHTVAAVAPDASLVQLLGHWAEGTLRLCLFILLVIYALMVVQQVIEHYRLMPRLARSLRPLMRLFGLPETTAYPWLVGQVLGISYGGALMKDQIDRGLLNRRQANDLNYHLVMNHSLLEDTCVFAAAGISVFWIIATRLAFALLVVWTRRALRALLRKG